MFRDVNHVRMILSGGCAAAWEYDHRSGLASCSAEVFTMLHMTQARLPTDLSDWLALVHPEDRNSVLDRISAEMVDDQLREVRFRISRGDGQWLWVHCRGRVVERDDRGAPLKTAGLLLDISNWHANIKDIAELIPVGIYTLGHYPADNSLSFLYVNDQLCKIMGHNKEALLKDARLAFDAALPEDRIRLDEANLQAAATGMPFLFEGRFLVNGDVRWLHIQSRPTFRRNGDSEWNGVVVDVTDLKAAQEALTAADRRKNDFLAVLAHELRNFLTPITNAIAALKSSQSDGPATPKNQQGLLTIAERQTNHLTRLVEDLLDVTRISEGKIALKKERIDLVALLPQAVDLVRSKISAQGHELEFALPIEPLLIDGDPVRLIQVFANLLDNAAKYTDHGGRIWIAAERRHDEAVITVGDTGIGIRPEMLPLVFDRFVQLERTVGNTHGGLGIGLTLVRNLVELHGGAVEAHSKGIGQGSEFTVRLPIW